VSPEFQGDEALKDLLEYYGKLVTFYQNAAQKGNAVRIYIN